MRVMTIREFLRGGYQDLKELTLITNHGRPIGTWMPQADAHERVKKTRSQKSLSMDKSA